MTQQQHSVLRESLAKSAGVARLQIVVLCLPGAHVLWQLLGHGVLALLSKEILVREVILHLIVGGVVLLVLLKYFWVVGQVLLVRSPSLICRVRRVVVVSHLEISRAYVVVVNSVFDVLHIVVGGGHADVAELVNHLFLGVLSAVSNSFVETVELLSKGLFSFLAVNL